MRPTRRRGAWHYQRWIVIGWLGLATGILQPSLGHAAQTEAIERGVAYLTATQNADGSWSDGEQQIVDTIEAFRALAALNTDTNILNRALGFIGAIPETDNEKLARKLAALTASTANLSNLVSSLTGVQNADGGWGLGGKKQSDVYDTILVVEALLSLGQADASSISKARDFLIAQQQADGSWIFAEEPSPSATARTALGLRALKDIEALPAGSSALITAVAKA